MNWFLTYNKKLEWLAQCFLLLAFKVLLSRAGLHLRIWDRLQFIVFDGCKIILVKVVVVLLQKRWLFSRVLRVVLDDKSGWVKLFLAVDLGLFVHIGKPLVLLLDAAEFNPAGISTFLESLLGIWEGDHEIKQVLFAETMAVGGLFNTWLVSLTGSQSVQNLVVTEVASRVEREILVAVFLRETQSDFASKDQV